MNGVGLWIVDGCGVTNVVWVFDGVANSIAVHVYRGR